MLKYVETCGSRTVQLKSFYLKLPVTASHCQSTSSRLGAQRKRANTRTASRAWKLKSPGALATCSVLADLAQTCLATEIPRLGKEINQINTRLKQASWTDKIRVKLCSIKSSSFQCLEWVLETEYNTSTI